MSDAGQGGESRAEIIRSALVRWLDRILRTRASPHWATGCFADPDLADKVDEILAEGFGRT